MTAKVKQSCRKIERQRADVDFRKCDRGMKKHAENSEASGMNRVRNTSPRSDHHPLAGVTRRPTGSSHRSCPCRRSPRSPVWRGVSDVI
ncbi:hypothetical protein [Burkholderia ubonensis]|uniref:hypothetical protein n=1 Tax=Burkholderia ubonensis TaxID=101571 RepID=UPI000F5938C4|nr:hypothetical protein [Burkholderia ubonensis]